MFLLKLPVPDYPVRVRVPHRKRPEQVPMVWQVPRAEMVPIRIRLPVPVVPAHPAVQAAMAVRAVQAVPVVPDPQAVTVFPVW
jgi:hypothetical protein